MAKFKILDALASGVISTYKTDEKDIYVMLISTTDKSFIVPLIKNDSGAVAYIDDAKYGIEDTIKIDGIINEVFAKNVYKNSGLFKYTPFHRAAPKHSHNILEYIKCTGGNESDKAKEILTKEGYTFVEKTLKTSFIKRDYSELLKIPEVKTMFDEDEIELKKVGATYDSLPTEAKIAYEAIEAGASGGIIFEGPTGTGKSFAARILANHAKAPLLNLQITYGTTVEDLVGMFIPCDDDSGAKWKFVMGPLLKAYVLGYQIVIEEINYGQPGVNAKLNEFTDGTTRITINGQTYKKHPNFVVYMTMNPGYEGTEPLNVALKNRFAKVSVPALTKAEFVKRARIYSRELGHELAPAFFEKVYDFTGCLEKEASSSKWRENVKYSIRNIQRVCDSILQKKRTFEEFVSIMAVQYFNDLSCDNDNSDKLEAYKTDLEIQTQLKNIYESYDFAENKVVANNKKWEDIFSEEDTTPEHEEKKDAMGKRLDGIATRFGLK